MEDPVREIPAIIHGLTTLTPSHQSHLLDKYFLPTASFHHPMCYVPSFWVWKSGPEGKPQLDSRTIIKGIYRWYKMLSPTVEMSIQSVAWDRNPKKGGKAASTLYVDCTQAMYFWFLPPWYRKAEVGFVVVLSLEQHEVIECHHVGQNGNELEEFGNGELRKATFVDDVGYVGERLTGREREDVERIHKRMKWYIAKQRDLYPPEDLAQFALFMPGATFLVYCFQIIASLFCVFASQVGRAFGFFPDEAPESCSECEDNARQEEFPSRSESIKILEGDAPYQSSRDTSRLSSHII